MIKKFKKEKEYKVPAGTLYDLNKQIMKKMKPLTHMELAPIQRKVEDWFNWEVDCYAMLLCHEMRDFTIFHMYESQNSNPPSIAARELMGCLTDRGEVLSMDLNNDKAWEIWLKIEGKPYCYYLFRYDNAVIEC